MDLQDPQIYLSRQLSWLEFNRRVLALAADEGRPLLERMRLLAIGGQNLDGFFMKRVGALMRKARTNIPRDEPWPLTRMEELQAVREAVRALRADQDRLLYGELLPGLAAHDVRLVAYGDLADEQRRYVDQYFDDELFPILTPLAVDPGRPFPFISNLSLSLAVMLRYKTQPPLFARVKLPPNRPRLLRIPETRWFLPLEQLVAHHLEALFRRMTIQSAHAFRVTRNADISRDEESADDLLDFAEDLVRERRFAPVVRLEIDAAMPPGPRALLVEELEVGEDDVYEVDGLLGHADLATLAALELPELQLAPWTPQPHPRLAGIDPVHQPERVFDVLREGDVLVHRPYHDYQRTLVKFIDAAAQDPNVRAIKQSLYRTSSESPTLEALIRAAEQGKEVTALLELKARLDEASNIAWARRLEQSGIHTSYGFVGFKTHTRMTLVVRDEPDGVRRYVHLSTGDYNHVTARSWTDLCLFSCREPLARDVTEFFNFLTGYADVPSYRRLVLAPVEMRQHFLERIEHEAERARAGRPGRIIAVMNALADMPLMMALCRASQAGVSIDLIIRGECCLRPGLPGVSENIRVRSVLGRFLEHQRVFLFGNDGDERIYISSADWMYRNLDHRIEASVPVEDPQHKAAIRELLELFLAETAAAWELDSSGEWRRVQPPPGEEPLHAQDVLMARIGQSSATSTASPSTFTS